MGSIIETRLDRLRAILAADIGADLTSSVPALIREIELLREALLAVDDETPGWTSMLKDALNHDRELGETP